MPRDELGRKEKHLAKETERTEQMTKQAEVALAGLGQAMQALRTSAPDPAALLAPLLARTQSVRDTIGAGGTKHHEV